jgi:hypothetical protein
MLAMCKMRPNADVGDDLILKYESYLLFLCYISQNLQQNSASTQTRIFGIFAASMRYRTKRNMKRGKPGEKNGKIGFNKHLLLNSGGLDERLLLLLLNILCNARGVHG